MGVKHFISGFSGVLIVPFITWLIVSRGWRVACVVGGLIVGLIGFPLAWFSLKRHRPEYYGMLPDGIAIKDKFEETDEVIGKGVQYAAEVKEVEFTMRQAMRTPAYWTLLVAHAFHSLVAPTISIHLIPFLTDTGIDPVKASGMMAMMMAVAVPSRLLGGLLADRVKIGQFRFLLAGAYLFEAVGIGIFMLFQTETMMYVWFVFYGTGMGSAWVLSPPLRARYFGRKAFGSIGGSQMLLMTPVGILAPIYAGWVYDTTGSYSSAFTLFAGLLFLAAAIACFILPPKPPVTISEISRIV